MVKNVLKIIAVFVIGVVGGIFADQIFWPYFIEKPLFLEYRLEQNPVYLTEEVHIQENVALQKAIAKVDKVVVGIRAETGAGRILEGSGLIVTSDGLVVTLDDFLPKGSEITLFFDGQELSSQVLQKKEGLALLKVKKGSLPVASFADFRKVRLGQRVFLIGMVLNKLGSQGIVNEGIVRYFDEDLIQTNILENLEGSVLFDIEGNVLGLNTTDKEGRIIAIPISKIKEFLGF
jgi:S1-C subfamily serine protease